VLLMLWLQITANTGPVECCLAVRKAFETMCREAQRMKVGVSIVEEAAGPVKGTWRSILLELDGPVQQVEALALRWSGSLLWVCESPYRKSLRRKNWFLSGVAFTPPSAPTASAEIRYEATRASGPGGQHVNKTDSAIRATHAASGLSVKVQTERSQFANKRLAGQLLTSKLAALAQEEAGQAKAGRRLHHHQAERGNAARVFIGAGFIERGADSQH
jgi:peptide chain release factor